MTTDKTTIPSVFTVKRIVKEKRRLLRKNARRDIDTDLVALEADLINLLKGINNYSGKCIVFDVLGNGIYKYLFGLMTFSLETFSYETVQKCLIVAKCIIESQVGQARAEKAEMFTGIFTDEMALYSKSHGNFTNGKLTYLVSGRFNNNWKKPMIVVKTLQDAHVVITEHTIDVTKYVGRMDKSKLITDLV